MREGGCECARERVCVCVREGQRRKYHTFLKQAVQQYPGSFPHLALLLLIRGVHILYIGLIVAT